MSLKLRLLAMITAILLLNLVMGGFFLIHNARLALQAEVSSNMELAQWVLVSSLKNLQSSVHLKQEVLDIIETLRRTRHVQVSLEDESGHPITTTHPQNEPPPPVPGWFTRLIKPDTLVFRQPIEMDNTRHGLLVLQADSSDEIKEVWTDVRTLALLALAFMPFISVLVYVALWRGLHPLNTLSLALEQMEKGGFNSQLQEPSVPELAFLYKKFNHMTHVIHKTMEENRHLAATMLSVREEERKELARELHDELGPCLFGIRVEATTIPQLITSRRVNEISERAHSILMISTQIQASVRKMLHRLRPLTLDDLGLEEALKDLVAGWQERHPGISWNLHFRGPLEELEETIKVSVFRIVQECLTNSARHSKATRVSILVAKEEDKVRIQGQDNGQGMAPDTPPGLGLIGMRERIQALGGTLTLPTSEDRGFLVEALIPLQA